MALAKLQQIGSKAVSYTHLELFSPKSLISYSSHVTLRFSDGSLPFDITTVTSSGSAGISSGFSAERLIDGTADITYSYTFTTILAITSSLYAFSTVPVIVYLSLIHIYVDVLVIGGGGAGASAAIEANEAGANVMIVTKLRIGDANTMMAEGGIQAADKANDSPAIHFVDAFGLSLIHISILRLLYLMMKMN